MSLITIDRRMAPRIDVGLAGELATGNCLVRIEVKDMSLTGCGVEIVDSLVPNATRFGDTGILSVRRNTTGEGKVTLPVMISNGRIDGGKLRFGLKFRRLSDHQKLDLVTVLDQVFEQRKAGAAATQ